MEHVQGIGCCIISTRGKTAIISRPSITHAWGSRVQRFYIFTAPDLNKKTQRGKQSHRQKQPYCAQHVGTSASRGHEFSPAPMLAPHTLMNIGMLDSANFGRKPVRPSNRRNFSFPSWQFCLMAGSNSDLALGARKAARLRVVTVKDSIRIGPSRLCSCQWPHLSV